jgi:hypothetical protein
MDAQTYAGALQEGLHPEFDTSITIEQAESMMRSWGNQPSRKKIMFFFRDLERGAWIRLVETTNRVKLVGRGCPAEAATSRSISAL